MFGLFKKKETGLPSMEKKIPMPEVKEPRFLTRDEANKISQDFVTSGKYDEGTLRLIRYMESGIKYQAKHGFSKYDYRNSNGYSFIEYQVNTDLIEKHFVEMGYDINIINHGQTNSGLYCEIRIMW
jgi:hypothetical protein